MITIIDYGLGNIKAFSNVYKNLEIPHKIAQSKEHLNDVSKMILPGVGSFDHAIRLLNKTGMREKIDELVLVSKIPVLGICVGMQLMANTSEEGEEKGLGWINAKVKKFNYVGALLPHMGWNSIQPEKENFLLAQLDIKVGFYFLHSYYFECENKKDSLATSNYGIDFSCGVNANNIYGVQFHPEKSHSNGIQLLKNFAKI